MQKSEKFNMENKIFRLSVLSTVNLTNKNYLAFMVARNFMSLNSSIINIGDEN